jgi:hypothetical protein
MLASGVDATSLRGPIVYLCYLFMAPEKRLLAWSSKSLCVVNDQPIGNPKRKV